MSCHLFDAIAGIGLVTVLYTLLRARRGASKVLPPGPKGYPLIGNVFDFPKEKDALHWAKYHKLYGV